MMWIRVVYVLLVGIAFALGLSVVPVIGMFRVAADPAAPLADGAGDAPEDGRQAVAALGRIEPESRVIEVSAARGDRLAQLFVTEGQSVEAGERLAVLDTHDERRAERNYIAAQLAEARRQLETTTAHGQDLIRQAELQLQTVERLYPLRIAAQQARVRQAEAELSQARTDLERNTRLSRTGASTEQESQRMQLLVQVNDEVASSARTVLEELQATLELERTLATARLAESGSSLAAKQAGVGVESLQGRLDLAEASLDRTIIRAPITGRILKVLSRPGERIETKPILQIADTRVMHAVAEVYVTDIRLVRAGHSAVVRSPALVKPLSGRVVEVGCVIFKNDVLGVDPASDVDARVVEVRVRLDHPEAVERLTNLQVDVEIHVDAAASRRVAQEGP